MQRPRHSADETYNQANDAESDCAGSVIGNGVHHDRKGEDVATHDEDIEQYLCRAEDFAKDGSA